MNLHRIRIGNLSLHFLTATIALMSCYGPPPEPVPHYVISSESISFLERPLFTFGIITDIQYCDCDTLHGRNYRGSLAQLDKALGVLKEKKVDFVVNLGDLIEEGWENLDSVLTRFDRSGIPVYHLIGNHDYEMDKTRNDLLNKLKLQNSYYSMENQGWRFVFLDGNDLSYYAPKPDLKVERDSLFQLISRDSLPQVKKWNGGMSQGQLKWLASSIRQSKQHRQRVVLFSHFPIFPPDKHNLWNAKEVLSLIESEPTVTAYISGHNHFGNYQRNGIHFWTLKAMVNSKEDPSFAYVKVFRDRLEVTGFGGELSKTLAR